jgi:WD repeat-containing protein 6
VYDLDSGNEPLERFSAQQTHTDDAITSIISIPSEGARDSSYHFLTTSRNGSYSIFSIPKIQTSERFSEGVSLSLVHQAFPPLGPVIEAAWFINSDLMLYGFRSKNFIVWNESKQYEVTSIECGGAHRSYAYMPHHEAGGAGHFVYTKASRIYLHSQSRPSHTVLKSGGHGREIKACARHAKFVATGAEDTTVRIFCIRMEGGEPPKVFITVDGEVGKYGNVSLDCCAVIDKHTAGIQHLQWSCSSGDYHNLFSAAGNEEFHVWAISEITGFGVGVVCEATLTDQSEDRDLRIMGFEVEFQYDGRPLTSVNGVATKPQGKHHIILIYSDSTIKLYDYSRTLGFQKTAQGKYTSACLTQVLSQVLSHKHRKIVSASTDGHLAFWEFPQPHSIPFQGFVAPDENAALILRRSLECTSRLQLHQSSISAIDILPLSLIRERGGHLIATGGDDNALNITLFESLQPKKRIIIPSAHATGITGVSFKSDCTGGMAEGTWYQLWTVGGDQRVKRWTIEFGHRDEDPKPTMENGFNMRVWALGEEDDIWCSVPDPAGLVTWRENFEEDIALVFGNGIEIFKLKDGFPNGDGMKWVGAIEKESTKTWEELQEEEQGPEVVDGDYKGKVDGEEVNELMKESVNDGSHSRHEYPSLFQGG